MYLGDGSAVQGVTGFSPEAKAGIGCRNGWKISNGLNVLGLSRPGGQGPFLCSLCVFVTVPVWVF